LRENPTAAPKQEIPENEEKTSPACRLPEKPPPLPRTDRNSDPGGFNADFIGDPKAGLKEEEELYNGGDFYCNC